MAEISYSCKSLYRHVGGLDFWRIMHTDVIENENGYLEHKDLRSGVIYDASQSKPSRIQGDLSALPAEYFGASEEFIDGFLGRPFHGPSTPERVGPYVRGEHARLKANNLI